MTRSPACKCAGLAPECISYRLGLCGRIDPATFQALSASAHFEDLPADRILWHDDHAPAFVGVVLSGILRFERSNSQGRRQVLNLLLPGEIFGVENELGAGYTIEAATDVRLCRFDAHVFDRLMPKDRRLRAEVYRQNVNRLERLRWLTWAIGALSPEERVAAFLVIGTDYMPVQPHPEGGCVLSVMLGRRDIADLLATTVESTCRILKSLERDGLIEMLDPRNIHIPDLAALAERGAIQRLGDRPSFPRIVRMARSARPLPLRELRAMMPINADGAPARAS
ncbi:Crp/Fnr family transcriptional regulator [Palleronia sp. KMU-117]|uniref:Crp/Fnr family transcriptional regulator n=1 Tax=Palleronia sp. KMU-117 TaxID=3434108 RepID=UPI003D71FFCD